MIAIVPFLVAWIWRFLHPQLDKILWTDHIPRFFLTFTCFFYAYDSVNKYILDGGDTICQKGLFLHHISSLLVIVPIVLNRYIPWWANPVAFMHGFCVLYPEAEFLSYIYAVAVMNYHYRIYQHPYRDLKYYNFARVGINGVWVFCIYLLIGDCSNFMPLSPD